MRFIERIHHSFRGYLNLQELRASWVASGAAGLAVASLIAVLEYTQGTLNEGPRSVTSGLVAMVISLVVVQLKQIKQGVPMPPNERGEKGRSIAPPDLKIAGPDAARCDARP